MVVFKFSNIVYSIKNNIIRRIDHMRNNLALRVFSFFAFLAVGYILSGVPVIGQEKIKEKDKSYAKQYKV